MIKCTGCGKYIVDSQRYVRYNFKPYCSNLCCEKFNHEPITHIALNSTNTVYRKKYTEKYFLDDKLRCVSCGRALHGSSYYKQINDKFICSYACAVNYKVSGLPGLTGHTIYSDLKTEYTKINRLRSYKTSDKQLNRYLAGPYHFEHIEDYITEKLWLECGEDVIMPHELDVYTFLEETIVPWTKLTEEKLQHIKHELPYDFSYWYMCKIALRFVTNPKTNKTIRTSKGVYKYARYEPRFKKDELKVPIYIKSE